MANTPNSRCFVFSVCFYNPFHPKTISSSILRIPEYRICFLTQLQGLIENTTDGIDNGIESLLFHCTSASFMDKYLDLPANGSEHEPRPSLPHLEGNDAPLTEMAKSAFEGEDQIHVVNTASETSDSFASLTEGGHPTGIDMSRRTARSVVIDRHSREHSCSVCHQEGADLLPRRFEPIVAHETLPRRLLLRRPQLRQCDDR